MTKQDRDRYEKELRRVAVLLQQASERDRIRRYGHGGNVTKPFDMEYDCIKLAYFAMAKAMLRDRARAKS